MRPADKLLYLMVLVITAFYTYLVITDFILTPVVIIGFVVIFLNRYVYYTLKKLENEET